MSRKEFMEELQRLLGELPTEEREEALRYYDSYFEEAGAEQEQVVLEEFGSAEKIAAQILQDYHAENHGRMYKEQGYQEADKSGITITNKGLSGGALVAVIIITILTFPIWISILGAAFGILMGLFGACVGITVGFGVGGIGCIVGGVAAIGIGLFKCFTIPVVGAGLIAIGLLVFGIGCLMLAAVGGIIKVVIWAVKGITNLFGRVFHGKKGARV